MAIAVSQPCMDHLLFMYQLVSADLCMVLGACAVGTSVP